MLFRSIALLSKPDTIPSNLHADVSKMTIGDVLVIRDLELPKGCTAVLDPEEAIVSIMAPRVAEAEATVESDESPLADLEVKEEPELVE